MSNENRVDYPKGNNLPYLPGYGGVSAGHSDLSVDEGGALVARSTVMTDEGSYRYIGSTGAFGISVGSATWTKDSFTVVGTGFLAYDIPVNGYLSTGSDGTATWYRIVSISDTEIELETAFPGTTTTATTYCAVMRPVQGTGASVTTNNGAIAIQSGTTASSVCELERDVDVLPLAKETEISISQRIDNQDIYVGFYDESSTTKYWAWFRFTGNNNRQVICETAFNRTGTPGSNEKQTTIVNLGSIPALQTVATEQFVRYRIECILDSVRFLVNDIPVALHRRVTMRPQDLLTSTIRVVNGTTPATSTTVLINSDFVSNYNRLAVSFADNNPLPVYNQDNSELLMSILKTLQIIANPTSTEVTSGRTRVVLDATGGAQTLGTVTTVGTVTTMSQIGAVNAATFIMDSMHNCWANTVRQAIT